VDGEADGGLGQAAFDSTSATLRGLTELLPRGQLLEELTDCGAATVWLTAARSSPLCLASAATLLARFSIVGDGDEMAWLEPLWQQAAAAVTAATFRPLLKGLSDLASAQLPMGEDSQLQAACRVPQFLLHAKLEAAASVGSLWAALLLKDPGFKAALEQRVQAAVSTGSSCCAAQALVAAAETAVRACGGDHPAVASFACQQQGEEEGEGPLGALLECISVGCQACRVRCAPWRRCSPSALVQPAACGPHHAGSGQVQWRALPHGPSPPDA
jgi:hypothetical protein